MVYLGDYAEDATLNFKWSTNDGDGASVTRATDGAVWVYKDDATGTEVQTGVTDTEDFDGLTGVHHCKIDLSSAAFYATGADYSVVLKAATIDGNVVNAVLAHFSIENRLMRGTDAGALASVCTEGRLAELDAANLPTDVAANNTAIGNLNDISAANVNTEVADVLKTDTISELSADPGATPTFEKALMTLYMMWKNSSTQTSTAHTLKNNAGTNVLTATDSDDATTFTRGKLA